jgi:hypothetical protein
LPIVSIYVPGDGAVIVNVPVADVVTVGSGDAGTPHGIDPADSPFRHVPAFGTAPSVTVNPLSAAPDVNSCAVPLTPSAVAVGVAVGAAVGADVEPFAGSTMGRIVPPPLDELPAPDELLPPPPHAPSANTITKRRP